MVVKVLSENTSISDELGHEHGLSLYIDTGDRKILFDTGASDLFLDNGRKMQVNISDVDTAVISHGHYDHGGGLDYFLRDNSKAKVFLHHLAFGKQYALRSNGNMDYIGLNEALRQNSRLIFTANRLVMGNGLQLFSNILHNFPCPEANANLLTEVNGKKLPDMFFHEQNLIVRSEGKTFLFTGCAHNGIENILERFRTLEGSMPDYAIGGLHLSSPSTPESNMPARIVELGRFLADTGVKFLTCHCTGIGPYNQLKKAMCDRIDYISAGMQLVL
jgi:7,8-dihydropterin-6-yl-methyl-4-(beta-D-ribofuranosyl)aminobenzene 5'-phosphate synthase